MLMDLVGMVTLIVTIASLIAASTPTPKDDVWMGKFYKCFQYVLEFHGWVTSTTS